MNPEIHFTTFHRQSIVSFSDGINQFIAIKPVCKNIGIQWQAQYHRIKRDERFNSVVSMMTTAGRDGKQYEMVCLPIEVFPGWLYTISASRVRQKIVRSKLLSYQQEATRVLYEHFMKAPRQFQREHNRLQIENERLKKNFIPDFIEAKRDEIFLSNMPVFYQSQWFWRLLIHFRGRIQDTTDIAGLYVSTLKPYVRRYRVYLRETRHIHLFWEKSHYDGFTAAELAPAYIHAGLDFWKMFYRNDPLLRTPDKYISKYEAGRLSKTKLLGGKS